MFILPFYQKINWRNPPVITILLIIINSFVYFSIQGEDDKYIEQAVQYYVRGDLPEIEIPEYIKYLKDKGEYKLSGEYRKVFRDEPDSVPYILMSMITDSGFMPRLENNEIIKPSDRNFRKWKEQRLEFNRLLKKAVWFSYGYRPGKPELVTSFTHMFLHGSIDHLLGNMIFLFIIGFVVEAIVGKSVYLFSYILAGLSSAGLDIVINSESIVPSIGASGAIAGLMGMYTILFGFRKINFFYFIIVYFDYVKAPAIILFPLWLGKEFYQLFWGGISNVNYLAHIGGLLSGGLIAFYIKRFTDCVDLEYMDVHNKEETRTKNYEDAMDFLSGMQYDKAAIEFKGLYEAHPENREYLVELYKAAKHEPGSDDYHFAARKIMSLYGRDPATINLIASTYREYINLCKSSARFTVDMLFEMAVRFSKNGYLDEAEQITRNLLKKKKQDERMPGILLALSIGYRKAGKEDLGKAYAEQLFRIFPESHEARHLKTI
ncbi:MAG: rhomboid family intramembrane serine protease [Gammaproteobacteria bacterium]|nr:MAG: rhomboid family intramembrane serine protease [Gammaproteobacteria bacterium]